MGQALLRVNQVQFVMSNDVVLMEATQPVLVVFRRCGGALEVLVTLNTNTTK